MCADVSGRVRTWAPGLEVRARSAWMSRGAQRSWWRQPGGARGVAWGQVPGTSRALGRAGFVLSGTGCWRLPSPGWSRLRSELRSKRFRVPAQPQLITPSGFPSLCRLRKLRLREVQELARGCRWPLSPTGPQCGQRRGHWSLEAAVATRNAAFPLTSRPLLCAPGLWRKRAVAVPVSKGEREEGTPGTPLSSDLGPRGGGSWP